ncbi:MAG: sulfatase-like hydrolase/transferase [Candidatus Brocadiia bacterium]
MRKPNILIVLSDQHGRPYSGCYGHPTVQTPNIDRLAERGVRFENAYCDSPLCVPSRSAFITGKRVSTVEQWDNNTVLEPAEPTMGHRLINAGYDAVLCGRMHFNGDDKCHGFRAQIAKDPDANATIPNWAAGGEVPGHDLTDISGRPRVGSGVELDDLAESMAIEYIERRSQEESPWAMVVGLKHPHGPWNAEQKYWDMYEEEEIQLPRGENPADDHPIHNRNRRLRNMPEGGFTEEVQRRNRMGYYAVISRMDDKIGNVLDALERSGQMENTVVVYISDHGEMLGEHDLWMKSSLFEESIGVPMIISIPGREAETRTENVTLKDLTATVCDYAGAELGGMDGRSFRGVLDGEVEWDNYMLCEYYATWTDRPLAAFRRDDLKLMAAPEDPVQLFDLARDPGETRDVSSAPEYRDARNELLKELESMWDGEKLWKRVIASQKRRMGQ